jgi:hypothetical protein
VLTLDSRGKLADAMKKLMLAALIAASCAAAQAEWTKLGTVASGNQDTLYVDSTTVRREGSRAKVWALTNYKSAQVRRGTKYRSDKAQFKFDCREETFETTMVMYMSGQMGEGQAVHTDTMPMLPVPVPPSSAAAALMEVACSAPAESGGASSSAPSQATSERADAIKQLQAMGVAGNAPGSGLSGSYAARIAAAVRPNIVYADVDQVSGNPIAEFDVSLATDGSIVGVKLRKSSGVPSWDDAAERGLRRTDKLPRDIDGRVHPVIVVALRPKG